MRRIAPFVLLAALLVGCAAAPVDQPAAPSAPPTSGSDQRFPDIVDAEVSRDESRYSFEVTVSSPYDTAQRYADAFRVRSADGTVFGVRELAHPHGGVFTRTLSGVAIPPRVDAVVVEGRDRVNGWGGNTVTVQLVR